MGLFANIEKKAKKKKEIDSLESPYVSFQSKIELKPTELKSVEIVSMRCKIQVLWKAGYSQQKITDEIGVHKQNSL